MEARARLLCHPEEGGVRREGNFDNDDSMVIRHSFGEKLFGEEGGEGPVRSISSKEESGLPGTIREMRPLSSFEN